MTLYLIGLGLWDEKDITVKGLEAVQKCDTVYLENYTSKLGCTIKDLEKFYDRTITVCDREFIEKNFEKVLEEAIQKDIALLIAGDPFGATTHIILLIEAKKLGVPLKIIHNASVLSAIGEIGLELYKYGKTVSIPFENKEVSSPLEGIRLNLENDYHTLVLLDLDPAKRRYMTIPQAIDYLLKRELDDELLGVGIAGLGSKNSEIKAGKLHQLHNRIWIQIPQCLIICSKELHFMEEEALKLLK